jgi:AcrR family transcriptional regulator
MKTNSSIKKKRTRLSPDDRREQLLYATKQYIVKNGLNSLTMSAVATQANVSKPLLYKYFDTRLELLQNLLVREEQRRYKKIRRELASAADYEQVVYAVVNHNFDERSKGDVFQILADQPDIAAALQSVRKNRHGNIGHYLVQAMMEEYTISKADAQKIMRMASAASISASEHHALYGGDRDNFVNLAVQFIFYGLSGFTKS